MFYGSLRCWVNLNLTNRKGFGEYSPNINRGVCGEQAESQGQPSLRGWQVAICLCKSRKNYSAKEYNE